MVHAPTDRIPVRREWVGPPPGTASNPTVWLFVATLALFGSVALAYWSGWIPAGWAIFFNTVAVYMSFTVMHESMHGVAHQNRTANRWLGQLTGPLLTVPLPLFRGVHYEHHSHTNDPDRDPDLFVAGSPRWLLPFWSLAVGWEYRIHYYGRRLWRDRRELLEALGSEAALIGIVLAAALTGHFTTLAVIWLCPAVLAFIFLVIWFDYMPHYPYDSDARYHDTRIYPGSAGFVILLGQNYHLIHHLWTTIPWYRYKRVFEEIRPELEARHARIGWDVTPPAHPGIVAMPPGG
jgi:beta-carotene hydroxylase